VFTARSLVRASCRQDPELERAGFVISVKYLSFHTTPPPFLHTSIPCEKSSSCYLHKHRGIIKKAGSFLSFTMKYAFGLAALAALATASDVHDLTKDTFDGFVKENDLVLAECKSRVIRDS
jgi:hypothetical protein